MKKVIIIVVIAALAYLGYYYYKKKDGLSTLSNLPGPDDTNGDDINNGNDNGSSTGTGDNPPNDPVVIFEEVIKNYELQILNTPSDYEEVVFKAYEIGRDIDLVLRFYAILSAKQNGDIPSSYGGETLFQLTQFVFGGTV